ncbi:MAG: tryptophan synthase subunit alpha [Proteobacteria bacterium]|nr:tryptophan synthase subunit alpha [Pseudomonadota bacterium]
MNSIKGLFTDLKKHKSKAFIPYITAGDPDSDKTLEILDIFVENGADIIELGVPFSDPMADGPVIQSAMERALSSGTTLRKTLEIVVKFKQKHNTPIILMGYLNPFFAYGFEKFAKDAKSSGVDGVLIVDLPPEETAEYTEILKKNKLTQIFLATPTTDSKRIEIISRYASGFIYFVSVTGVTGARNALPFDTASKLEILRTHFKIPVVLGFGISGPETIEQFYNYADGFVVGSAIVKKWEIASRNPQEKQALIDFIKQLSKSCHGK